MSKAQGSDRERWKRRHSKLKHKTERIVRQVSRRTSTIARVFDRVTDVLIELGYVTDQQQGQIPTEHGERLRRIFGERDLLIAECVRRGYWNTLTAVQLATIAAAIVYEPRREDESWEPYIPAGALRDAYDLTLATWAQLDELEQQFHLPRKEHPHPGLMPAMQTWAAGGSIEKTLSDTHLVPGDMVRVTTQTIDLLDQLSGLGVPLSETAREAKRLIDRGVVAASRSAG